MGSKAQDTVLTGEQEVALEDLGYVLSGSAGMDAPGPLEALSPQGVPVLLRLVSLSAGAGRVTLLRRLTELRRLRHPGLARLLDLHELPGGVVAACWQRVEGVDLAVLLGARGRLRRDEAAQLLTDLGEALAHLHEQGLAHGDVSTANTIITPAGNAVLIDLLGEVCESGTEPFAAPERADGARPNPASDVRALAVLVEQSMAVQRTALGHLALLEDALSDEPMERPTARELAERAPRLAAPAPIELPEEAELAVGMLRSSVQVPTRRALRPWWRRRGAGCSWERGRRRENRGCRWGRDHARRRDTRLPELRQSDREAPVLNCTVGVETMGSEQLVRRGSGRVQRAASSGQGGRHCQRRDGAGRRQHAAPVSAGLEGALRGGGRGSGRRWSWAGAPVGSGVLLTLVVMVSLLALAWRPAIGLWTTGGEEVGWAATAGPRAPQAPGAPTGTLSGVRAGSTAGVATSPTPSATKAGAAGAMDSARMSDDDLLRVVVGLARSRDAALEAGDAQALTSTTVPGSGAASADEQLLKSLRDSGQTVTGLRTQLQGVVEVPVVGLPLSAPAPEGARAVRAILSQAPHQRHAGAGDWTVPVQHPRQVVLVLVPGPWRVLEVLEAEGRRTTSSNLG